MIEITDIHFRHPNSDTPILKGVSMHAEAGKLTAILGPNGSGKTTLFKCIAGIWKPGRGDIRFQGQSLLNGACQQRAKMIAVVPQEHEPPFPYSVLDVVLIGRTTHVGLFSTPSKEDVAIAEACIEAVGIGHLKDRAYTNLSGGERQMVLVARALAQQSPVMLFDEPTSHLDIRNQVGVLLKIKEMIHQRRITAIMTIHDPNLAMLFSDGVVLLGQGRIVAQGEPNDVITAETLGRVYAMEMKILQTDGMRFVIPRCHRTDPQSS